MGLLEILYIVFMVLWLFSLGAYGAGPLPNRAGSFVPWIVVLLLGLEVFHFLK
jgi:hypothetical protein